MQLSTGVGGTHRERETHTHNAHTTVVNDPHKGLELAHHGFVCGHPQHRRMRQAPSSSSSPFMNTGRRKTAIEMSLRRPAQQYTDGRRTQTLPPNPCRHSSIIFKKSSQHLYFLKIIMNKVHGEGMNDGPSEDSRSGFSVTE